MFSQTDFCNYALQILQSDQTLEQQIQTLINKLQQTKPNINEEKLSTQLKQLQNQYNSKVQLINQVRSKLESHKDSIQVSQSQEMSNLLEVKQRYENMKLLLTRKDQIYQNYQNIMNQKVTLLSQLSDTLQLDLTEDFQYIRQNNLYKLQGTMFKDINDKYLDLCLTTINKQPISQQLIALLKQIPEILSIYLSFNENADLEQIENVIQNSTILCSQQSQINSSLKEYILNRVNDKQIQYNQLLHLTNTLDKYLKSSIAPQNSKEYKKFYVSTLLQTKYSQNNISTLEDLISNSPNHQFSIESDIFVHLFIAIIEQSKEVYEQMNVGQLNGLINKIKQIFSDIYSIFKGKINVASSLTIKNDPNHIKTLMQLQKILIFDDTQKSDAITQLFDAIILSLLLSEFIKIIQSMNGAKPDKFMQSRQLPHALQAAEDIKTIYQNEKRVDGTLWINIISQKVIQLWEKAVGSQHCDLVVLKAVFDEQNQQSAQQNHTITDV